MTPFVPIFIHLAHYVFFKLYLPYFMRMSFLPACMSASRMCMVSQKVRWQSWNWELKTAVSCYMSSGNRTWVRCKNSKCFQQLSHLSRFGIVSLRLTDFVANVSSMATVYYMVTSHFRFFYHTMVTWVVSTLDIWLMLPRAFLKHLCICFWVWVWIHGCVGHVWRSKNNSWKSVLSFIMWVAGIKLRP